MKKAADLKSLTVEGFSKYPRRDSNAQPLAPEAKDANPQTSTETPLTESELSVLASCLAQIVQKYPELARLIEAWPTLPEQTKSKITDLIEKHTTERKADAEETEKG